MTHGGSGILSARAVEDVGDTRRGSEDRWTVSEFGHQNPGKDSGGIRVESPRRSEDRWWDRKACVETKQGREVIGSVRCSKKKLNKFAPGHVIGVVDR